VHHEDGEGGEDEREVEHGVDDEGLPYSLKSLDKDWDCLGGMKFLEVCLFCTVFHFLLMLLGGWFW